MTSHKLFPSATLVVPESEAADYAAIRSNAPRSRMPSRACLPVRNWILSHFQADAIVMLDDDITACVCMVSLRCRKLSPDETLAMLTNTAWCARGAGPVSSAGTSAAIPGCSSATIRSA